MSTNWQMNYERIQRLLARPSKTSRTGKRASQLAAMRHGGPRTVARWQARKPGAIHSQPKPRPRQWLFNRFRLVPVASAP
jgi:hypothetical protein